MNLFKLIERYDSDDKCRATLEKLRWPLGVRGIRCNSDKVYRAKKRNQFECAPCGYHFSVTTGTIFHDTHLPLRKWFIATYLICESKKGVSALQLKRTLGVAYKTAWYLCHRIREAVKDVDHETVLSASWNAMNRILAAILRTCTSHAKRNRPRSRHPTFRSQNNGVGSLAA